MIFNSLQFLAFFPIAFGVYLLVPPRQRWLWLLACSYYFYSVSHLEYLVLILTTTVLSYAFALAISKASGAKRSLCLALCIIGNLSILFVFKYWNFFSTSVAHLGFNVPLLQVALPVGISFYTFQAIAYTVDVYQKKVAPVSHFGTFALYVSFFPQLVAGPIERAKDLLPQLTTFERPSAEDYRVGVGLIILGFFKKVVIADRLSVVVDTVYSNVELYSGTPLIIATVLFAFQIYCDFSGYCDIATGIARFFGVRLSLNFRQPYFSRSVTDFWRRWHITLSQWFRDYVYIPLGGNRVALLRLVLNVLIVFLISGLWHGAAWTYVIWGGLHGLCIALENVGKRYLPPLPNTWPVVALQMLITFIVVCISWVFFRANSLADAWYVLMHLHTNLTPEFGFAVFGLVSGLPALGLLLAPICVLIGLDVLSEHSSLKQRIARLPQAVHYGFYSLLVVAIALFGIFDEQSFIYFQF